MIAALIAALRPKQWTKNLLLFAGVLFSLQMTDLTLVGRAFQGFLAFSLLSGSVYMLNDLLDIESDRLHPVKRKRAIASGRLPAGLARVLLPVIAAIGMAIAWPLGNGFRLVLGLYLFMNLAYSFWLKHQVLIDVFVIALGFVLRAIAGVQLLIPVSPQTAISPWLLVCTFFGALFLALAKRRRELENHAEGAGQRRVVLRSYTPEMLDGMLILTAAASLMAYALYTIWPATVAKFHTEALLYTVPFVAYGLFRYLFLIKSSSSSEDPSQVLLTDRPLAACVMLYVATVGFLLYAT